MVWSLEDGRVLVERQYRYPIEQAVIEIGRTGLRNRKATKR